MCRILRTVILFCIFFFTGTVFAQQLSDAPFWYLNVPVYDNCLFGIGTGASLEDAMAQARTDLASQKESRIFHDFLLKEFEENNDGAILTSTEFEITTRQVVDTILDSAVRVDMKVTEEGFYYVLICSSLDETQPLSQTISSIRDDMDNKVQTHRRNSTITSVVLPGAGHMVNHRTAKGVTLLAVAAASLAFGTYTAIQADYEQQMSSKQTNRELQEYHSSRATSFAYISLGCFSLFAIDSIYSSLDNYRSYDN